MSIPSETSILLHYNIFIKKAAKLIYFTEINFSLGSIKIIKKKCTTDAHNYYERYD